MDSDVLVELKARGDLALAELRDITDILQSNAQAAHDYVRDWQFASGRNPKRHL
jgi:hypothetical protein